MCKRVLPPGDNPIAVKKYIILHLIKIGKLFRNVGLLMGIICNVLYASLFRWQPIREGGGVLTNEVGSRPLVTTVTRTDPERLWATPNLLPSGKILKLYDEKWII